MSQTYISHQRYQLYTLHVFLSTHQAPKTIGLAYQLAHVLAKSLTLESIQQYQQITCKQSRAAR